jgi:hypothetical protein
MLSFASFRPVGLAECLALVWLTAGGLAQQPPPAGQGERASPAVSPPEARLAAATAAIAAAERWLGTDQTDVDGRDAIVRDLLLASAAPVDAWFQAVLQGSATQPQTPRAKGVRALATQFALGHVQQQLATEITFVGQYDRLHALQPFVTELFFDLLLETPEWFAYTRRLQLVAPLRDLVRQSPPLARRDAVARLVENERIEPEDLRRALAAALAQWGMPEPAARVVAELRQAASDGDGPERLATTLELADYYVQLRDYKSAASAHRTAQALAKSAGVPLLPIAWYAATCVHALLGDVERAFAALEQCTARLAAPELDPSHRLRRTMFDLDPELAVLRGDPRFARLVAAAFPTPEPPAGGR